LIGGLGVLPLIAPFVIPTEAKRSGGTSS
jgi:hypothetical protein